MAERLKVPLYHTYKTIGEDGITEYYVMRQVTDQRSSSIDVGPYAFEHQAKDVALVLNRWAPGEL